MTKIVSCKNCGVAFKKEISQINRSKTGNHFCCRSCAASYNNSIKPKRRLKRICSKIGCDDVVKSYRHSLCEKHHREYMENKRSEFYDKTIGEYRNRKSVKDKHPSWLHSHIRIMARNMNAEMIKKPCAICGYYKHVELCHITPVSNFGDEARISEVNGKNNVIQLCRNCHWEFDNGLLKLPE